MREWTRMIVVGLISISGFATPAMADPSGSDNFNHGHMWGGGWGFMGAGFMLLFWALTILAIVVAVRWLMSQNGGSKNGEGSNVLETLRDRLARVEIEIEEFEARKRALDQ